jgi:hypothetical protein
MHKITKHVHIQFVNTMNSNYNQVIIYYGLLPVCNTEVPYGSVLQQTKGTLKFTPYT